MHVFSAGQPCAQSSGVGHHVRTPNSTRLASHADQSYDSSPSSGNSSLGRGSFLVTFPGEAVPPAKDKHAAKRSSHQFHFDHRGGPLKYMFDYSPGDGETLDTPFRCKKFSPRPETERTESPMDPPLPVCNLNKLNAMLDAEAREQGGNLPVLNSRRSRGVRPRATYTRQTHNYYKIVENEQVEGAPEPIRQNEDRQERKKYTEKKEPLLVKSTASSASTAAGNSGSFLRGSAIGGTEERPIRNRRRSYDARAFANKAARKRTLDKCNMEKFASLPNLNKSNALISQASGENGVSVSEYHSAEFKSSIANAIKFGNLETTSKSETKLPALSARSEIVFDSDATENKAGDMSVRSELADSSISNLTYSFHGSTSKGSSRARALSLKDMTEAFRKHMSERFDGQNVNMDKRWAQKMSKDTKVIDNNSYEIYARKPLPKYSVSKLALSQVTQLLNMSTEDMATVRVQDNPPDKATPEFTDDCDVLEEFQQEHDNFEEYYYHNGCYPPGYYHDYFELEDNGGRLVPVVPHGQWTDKDETGYDKHPQSATAHTFNIDFTSEHETLGESKIRETDQSAPSGTNTLVENNGMECRKNEYGSPSDLDRIPDIDHISDKDGYPQNKGGNPVIIHQMCDSNRKNYSRPSSLTSEAFDGSSLISRVCNLNEGNGFTLRGSEITLPVDAAE